MFENRKLPLATALATIVGVLVAVSTAVVLLIQAGNAWRVTRDLVAENATSVVESVADKIESYLSPARTLVTALDQQRLDGKIDIDDPSSLTKALSAAPLSSPQIGAVVYLNKQLQGVRVLQTDDGIVLEDADLSRSDYVRSRMEQTKKVDFATWQGFLYIDEIKSSVITAAKALKANGEFVGAFAASVQLRSLSEYLRDISERDRAEAFILYEKDKVIAHRSLSDGSEKLSLEQPLQSLDQIDDPVLAKIWSEDRDDYESHKNYDAHGVSIGSEYYVFVYKTINQYGGEPWTIGVYFRGETIGASFDRLAVALGVAVMFIVLALLFGYWLAKKLSRPVLILTDATESVATSGPVNVQPLKGSRIKELDSAAMSFNHMVDGLKDREKTRLAFSRFVPPAVVSEIINNGNMLEPQSRLTTTLFTDIAGFTAVSETQSPKELIVLLNEYFALITPAIEQFGGVIYQFQGDAVLATFNLPVENELHAANAVRAAIEIQTLLQTRRFGKQQIQLKTRIGVNTGEAVCGLVGGGNRLGFTVHGDDVNVASRVESMNKQFDTNILVTDATADLAIENDASLKNHFREVGKAPVRGRSQEVTLFEVLLKPQQQI